jgi:hypothetical protein
MKNFIKWFGIIAFVAIIGFSLSSCRIEDAEERETDELDGTTWQSDVEYGAYYVLTFNSPNFTWDSYIVGGERDGEKTTWATEKYSISGSTVTMEFQAGAQTATISGTILTFLNKEYVKQ